MRVQAQVVDTRSVGQPRPVALDVVVHFVKANGSTGEKVFKGGVRELAPGEQAGYACTVSLAQHSTRTHYAGTHRVQVQVNGRRWPAGSFTLRER